MQIIVTDHSAKSYSTGDYLFIGMTCGKHSATVVVCTGKRSYVQVVVHNAANRCWRGMGKDFDDRESAKANYKTGEIRAMIDYACDEAERIYAAVS